MGKVLVSASHFDTLCQEAWALLEKEGHQVVYDKTRPFPAYSYEELREIIGDIDAAIIGMDQYNEDVFKLAGKLKAVAKFGVGVDNIDLDAASRHGVKVLNAPGQNSNAVAELTYASSSTCCARSSPPIRNWKRASGPARSAPNSRAKRSAWSALAPSPAWWRKSWPVSR